MTFEFNLREKIACQALVWSAIRGVPFTTLLVYASKIFMRTFLLFLMQTNEEK